MQSREDNINAKIKALDAELQDISRKRARARKGSAVHRNLTAKATRLLRQRRMYVVHFLHSISFDPFLFNSSLSCDPFIRSAASLPSSPPNTVRYDKQRDQLSNQQFNVEQTKFALDNVRDSKQVVDAMKGASRQLQSEYKDFNIDDLEDLQDDMGEMLELADEINEVLGTAFGVPEDIDEEDLDAELDALNEEFELDELAEEEDFLRDIGSGGQVEKPVSQPSEEHEGSLEDSYGLEKRPQKLKL